MWDPRRTRGLCSWRHPLSEAFVPTYLVGREADGPADVLPLEPPTFHLAVDGRSADAPSLDEIRDGVERLGVF